MFQSDRQPEKRWLQPNAGNLCITPLPPLAGEGWDGGKRCLIAARLILATGTSASTEAHTPANGGGADNTLKRLHEIFSGSLF